MEERKGEIRNDGKGKERGRRKGIEIGWWRT